MKTDTPLGKEYRKKPVVIRAKQWFKVGDHCDLGVTCEGNGFSYSVCCNFAASLIKGWPRWVNDKHGSTNPF